MVLPRLEGLSDREAAKRYAFDARWRYASGVGSYATGGWTSFAHTVLVDMRMRLQGSARPKRVSEVTPAAAWGPASSARANYSIRPRSMTPSRRWTPSP
jgi:hypothetical protein